MAEATQGIVNSGKNTWNDGGDSRWAMAGGMGNGLGAPSSKESRGMAEATPGTTNWGTHGIHGMVVAIPGRQWHMEWGMA